VANSQIFSILALTGPLAHEKIGGAHTIDEPRQLDSRYQVVEFSGAQPRADRSAQVRISSLAKRRPIDGSHGIRQFQANWPESWF
jgi:hypothetical protein